MVRVELCATTVSLSGLGRRRGERRTHCDSGPSTSRSVPHPHLHREWAWEGEEPCLAAAAAGARPTQNSSSCCAPPPLEEEEAGRELGRLRAAAEEERWIATRVARMVLEAEAEEEEAERSVEKEEEAQTMPTAYRERGGSAAALGQHVRVLQTEAEAGQSGSGARGSVETAVAEAPRVEQTG